MHGENVAANEGWNSKGAVFVSDWFEKEKGMKNGSIVTRTKHDYSKAADDCCWMMT